MDFDEEMSSLQIEDLGEYFFPNELNNESWKGFSLGYVEEEKVSAPISSNSSNTINMTTMSKPIAISSGNKSHLSLSAASRDISGSLSNSLGGGGISLGAMLHDTSLLVSPPMLASSFSEMLKQSGGSLAAAALGFANEPEGNFALPASAQQAQAHAQAHAQGNGNVTMQQINRAANSLTINTNLQATSSTQPSPPKTKDDELMDLANFTLEGRFNADRKQQLQRTMQQLQQRPPLNPATRLASNGGSNTAAVCKSIMDEDDDDDDDDDDERMDYSKRSSSGASTPSSASNAPTMFGSKRSFDMVESCSAGSCSTIAPEEDRGYRKKSREKMRRQEVNVKFDELIDLLGLSNRVRKSAILQEAVSAIKTLKREREEMRRERDRLQQEVSKLATCLQYSHLGSVAAANAVAMSQANQGNHFQHINPQQLSQMNPHAAAALSSVNHQMPGPGCFPIGSSFGPTLAPAGGSVVSNGVSNATPIAPKVIKSANDLKA